MNWRRLDTRAGNAVGGAILGLLAAAGAWALTAGAPAPSAAAPAVSSVAAPLYTYKLRVSFYKDLASYISKRACFDAVTAVSGAPRGGSPDFARAIECVAVLIEAAE